MRGRAALAGALVLALGACASAPQPRVALISAKPSPAPIAPVAPAPAEPRAQAPVETCAVPDERSADEERADWLRDDAMAHFQHEDYDLALHVNRRAILHARKLPAGSWRTIENYDDAGLYFYTLKRYRQAARYQAIAVLLALDEPQSAAMLPEYLQRLGWAFGEYRPAYDFGRIVAKPKRLFGFRELKLRRNYDIHRKYKR
ncbi:MAG TPA: hypothetical protein VM074_10500 [Solimonas sp.]|nr:hypothetical protein [Solimonas sp.]